MSKYITSDSAIKRFVIFKRLQIVIVLLLWVSEGLFSWFMLDRIMPKEEPPVPSSTVETHSLTARPLPSSTPTSHATTKIHYFTVLNTIVALISLGSMLQSYKILRKVRRVKKLEKYGHEKE